MSAPGAQAKLRPAMLPNVSQQAAKSDEKKAW